MNLRELKSHIHFKRISSTEGVIYTDLKYSPYIETEMKSNNNKHEKHSWCDVPGSPHVLQECWKCGCHKGYSPPFKKIVYTKDRKIYEKAPPCVTRKINEKDNKA